MFTTKNRNLTWRKYRIAHFSIIVLCLSVMLSDLVIKTTHAAPTPRKVTTAKTPPTSQPTQRSSKTAVRKIQKTPAPKSRRVKTKKKAGNKWSPIPAPIKITTKWAATPTPKYGLTMKLSADKPEKNLVFSVSHTGGYLFKASPIFWQKGRLRTSWGNMVLRRERTWPTRFVCSLRFRRVTSLGLVQPEQEIPLQKGCSYRGILFSGLYRLSVKASRKRFGNFNWHFKPTKTTQLSLGKIRRDIRLERGDAHFYRFNVASTGLYMLRTYRSWMKVTPKCALYDHRGKSVVPARTQGYARPCLMPVHLPTGSYWVRVSSFLRDKTGKYGLGIHSITSQQITPARPLTQPWGKKGSLRFFQFTASSDGNYTFHTRSKAFKKSITLFYYRRGFEIKNNSCHPWSGSRSKGECALKFNLSKGRYTVLLSTDVTQKRLPFSVAVTGKKVAKVKLRQRLKIRFAKGNKGNRKVLLFNAPNPGEYEVKVDRVPGHFTITCVLNTIKGKLIAKKFNWKKGRSCILKATLKTGRYWIDVKKGWAKKGGLVELLVSQKKVLQLKLGQRHRIQFDKEKRKERKKNVMLLIQKARKYAIRAEKVSKGISASCSLTTMGGSKIVQTLSWKKNRTCVLKTTLKAGRYWLKVDTGWSKKNGSLEVVFVRIARK